MGRNFLQVQEGENLLGAKITLYIVYNKKYYKILFEYICWFIIDEMMMIAICTNQFFIVFWRRSYLYFSTSIGLNTEAYQVVNYLLLATNSLRRVLFLFYLQLRLQSCTFVVSISSCLGYNSLGRDTTLRERPLYVLQSQSPCRNKKQGCYRGFIDQIFIFAHFLYMEHYERKYHVHISTTGAKKI